MTNSPLKLWITSKILYIIYCSTFISGISCNVRFMPHYTNCSCTASPTGPIILLKLQSLLRFVFDAFVLIIV